MAGEHNCIHEQELGGMRADMTWVKDKLDQLVMDFHKESLSNARTLESMIKTNEQTALLLATLQNTMHGPNRDNGLVQTSIENARRVANLEADNKVLTGKIESSSSEIKLLKEKYIRVTAIVSTSLALGVNVIIPLLKFIWNLLTTTPIAGG